MLGAGLHWLAGLLTTGGLLYYLCWLSDRLDADGLLELCCGYCFPLDCFLCDSFLRERFLGDWHADLLGDW